MAVGKALDNEWSHTDVRGNVLGLSLSDVVSRPSIEVVVANLASRSSLKLKVNTWISSLPEMVVSIVGSGCGEFPPRVNSSGSTLVGATPPGVGVTSLWISDVVWFISDKVNWMPLMSVLISASRDARDG